MGVRSESQKVAERSLQPTCSHTWTTSKQLDNQARNVARRLARLGGHSAT